MDNKTQDKGFTLVELLIVIVILGILATVTVFAVRGITDSGQESACNADEKTLQVAVEAYFAQNGGTALPEEVQAGVDPAPAASVSGTLVNAGFLVDVSPNYTVSTAGALTATGACV